MSDQPKPMTAVERALAKDRKLWGIQPKPTGEWTAYSVMQLRQKHWHEADKNNAIAIDHNAELAAAREKWKSAEDLTRDNGRLHGELEKVLRENDQLRTQLAAEREKVITAQQFAAKFKLHYPSMKGVDELIKLISDQT